MNKVNALVLAGDSNKGEFGPDIINKSFIEIDGKWLVEYVVDALRESHRIHSISIVGPVERLENRLDGKVDYFIQEEKHILENLQIGLEPFKEDDFVIVVTSDIPMINGDVISDFIERCSIYEADLCYPIVDKKVNNRLYPGFSRTYVKLKDGTFTGGNIVGINPEKMKSYWEFASRIIEKRKKPLELGRLLGPRFLLLLATGQLSIAHIEERFFELLKIKARAIISPYPEIANDIDQPGHIEIVNQYLKK